MSKNRFIVPQSYDRQQILDEIERGYATTRETGIRTQRCFYDTFDWRLYNKELTGFLEDNQFTLARFDERPVAAASWRPKSPPKFWWDVPDSPLRQELQKVLSVRALLPLAAVELYRETIRILNQDQKTVLWVQWQEAQPEGATHSTRTVTLLPVRGYRDEARDFNEFLLTLGLTQTAPPLFLSLLRELGKTPGDYSSKIDLSLSRKMSTHAAAREVLQFLLTVITRNEEGIKQDIDTEFLHDFRVAIRRTRAALRQIKGVFPKETQKGFRKEFRWIGKLTNRLRDLDVYLLERDKYRHMLPEQLQPGLDPLFDSLQRERKRELKQLQQALESERYHNLIGSWQTFLQKGERKGKNADRPAADLARKFIRKQHRKVMEKGAQIDAASPDSDLHSLRIDCKRLRYLLEFFTSLFPKNEMKTLVKQLKRLQDNLGEYNDLHVQTEELSRFLHNRDPAAENNTVVAAALGGLIALLHEQQQRIRGEFGRRFEEFSAPESVATYEKLFSAGGT